MSTLKAPDLPTGGELLYDASGEPPSMHRAGAPSRCAPSGATSRRKTSSRSTRSPYSTTVEAIMDKVAELIKSGKIREIADMRDETDLSGLKLTIDLEAGHRTRTS